MHKTRSEVSTTWPIPRKGTKFVVVPLHNQKRGIPILIVIRDLLKLAKTRKETKKILMSEKIKVNGKVVKEERFPLVLFDIVEIENKNYRLALKNGRLKLEETKEKKKIAKIINKKILPKGRTQVNLSDGRNFISKERVNTGDSVIFNFEENKISKIVPLKENSDIVVTSGSHMGETGRVEEIDAEKKQAKVILGKEKVSLELKRLMAV